MRIFCSGIGGIGLSAYASLQAHAGHTVAGSDRTASGLTETLSQQGITVYIDQSALDAVDEADLYVYSEAIPVDAPDRVRAKERGIRSLSYFAALGELTRSKRVIAICGTHGKSSTTAMVARMLIETGHDPSVVVGTKMRELDGRNWRAGSSDLFVVEACEYRRSFHYLSPSIVLMISVDGDHFDAYNTLEEYQQAYVDFLRLLPEDGVVITHGSDPDCVAVVQQSGRQLLDADAQPHIHMATPGSHMRENAQLVLELAKYLHIEQESATQALAGFAGTWRRMEVRGDRPDGVTVVNDYAHHPIEITATLSAMREQFGSRRLICVFQPHTHDRTLRLYDAFAGAFKDADLVVIPDIYNARSDIETKMVDVESFVADIARVSNVPCMRAEGMAATPALLESILQPNDVLICMGAGSIGSLADTMLQR